MANKVFNTKIKLRYDSFENWTTANPVLLSGEMAITTVVAADAQSQVNPTILLKVGDSVSHYNDLGFVSGLASDVYSWAKAEKPPVVNAEDVAGLAEYISNQVDGKNTQYRIVADENDASKLYLQSTEDASAETPTWTTVSTFNSTKVEAGTIAGTIKVNGTDMTITGWTALNTQVTTNTEAIETLNGTVDTEGSVANQIKGANDALRTELETEITSKISSTYKPAGSIEGTALTADLLTATNVGKVYNISTEFTSTTDFVEGEGKTYQAGANVVVINSGTEEAPIYKFDVLMGLVDLSNYPTKPEMNEAIEGAIEAAPVKEVPVDKVTGLDEKVTEIVNTELTKEPVEGEEPSALQTTIKNVASEAATAEIAKLNNTDAEVAGQFITEAKEENGIVSVKRTNVDIAQLVQNTEDTIVLAGGNATTV